MMCECLSTAPERRLNSEWLDTPARSPYATEPQLAARVLSDLSENNRDIVNTLHKSPVASLPSSLFMSPPASHSGRLQQLENCDAQHGRVLKQSPRKLLLSLESPSPGKRSSSEMSSSDISGARSPTSSLRLNAQLSVSSFDFGTWTFE